ncbi:Serine/threonine-protein kinase PK-1 [Corynebacterium kalinowskii]|uniref:non-specific serine/threonine protein kinase n=1 Tax=Corynebacterium kalinowskii TaxID=2675216 RepID=A0A6B8VC19_9CORY|nr:Stk1 family PASTA domain-containing Ser/Thr kinase [Corynebacterium kalinowskii]QGU01703.1 Serine/threonine-protein kinase PK-1 [Corynebacterium kalinowskii]
MSSVQVGDIVDDRYRLDAQIAKGGMSTVFRGEDLRLGRAVAVKVMDDRYLDDAIFRSRFVREAKSMALLSHPNIVDVYDFNSTGAHVYLVMELISGGTLRELLAERGPMPPHAATQVMRGLLTGLSVAHQQGLVHRDIKPDNVLISQDHRVKLTDFGLVRAVAQSDRTSDQIVGTVSYLSPEQVGGETIGPESDVYSAGILLFELLTGTTPFTGDTQLAHAMQRLTNDVPAPSSRIEGVPALFDELVAAATHRDPDERFPTAAQFLAALEDVATELALPSFKVPVPRNTAVARATEVVTPRPAPAVPQSTSILPPYEPPAPPVASAPETAAFPVLPPTPEAPAAPIVPRTEQYLPEVRPPQEVEVAFEEPKPVSNRSPIKLLAWLMVVVMLIAAVAVGGWWFGSGRYGEIPQILGLDKDTAVAKVVEAGFAPVVSEIYSDDVPVGQAVGTEPPFGQRVPRSDEVAVLVSKGQPTVPAVPLNGDIAAFRHSLEERTLSLAFGEDAYSDTIPVGGIAAVSPAAGVTVHTGSTVTAQISKGPAPVEVPDVTGKDQATATSLLSAAGLSVRSVTEAFSSQHPKGAVISTTPGAGSKLSRGSEVELKVSNALEVPDVEGLSLEEATTELTGLGFVVVTEETNDAREVPHEVVGMSKKEGDLVNPEAAQITLKIAGRVKVTSVTGLSVEEATQKLQDQGLNVAVRRAGDHVLIQSPRAGAKVAPGDTIELTAI